MNTVFRILTKIMKGNYKVEKKDRGERYTMNWLKVNNRQIIVRFASGEYDANP